MKIATREELLAYLEKRFPKMFLRTTEEFDGSVGGIWTSGEASMNQPMISGQRVFDYYSENKQYELGVLKKFEESINKKGWFSQWNDCGTIMLYLI